MKTSRILDATVRREADLPSPGRLLASPSSSRLQPQHPDLRVVGGEDPMRANSYRLLEWESVWILRPLPHPSIRFEIVLRAPVFCLLQIDHALR